MIPINKLYMKRKEDSKKYAVEDEKRDFWLNVNITEQTIKNARTSSKEEFINIVKNERYELHSNTFVTMNEEGTL